jgi:hypothetical protein
VRTGDRRRRRVQNKRPPLRGEGCLKHSTAIKADVQATNAVSAATAGGGCLPVGGSLLWAALAQ